MKIPQVFTLIPFRRYKMIQKKKAPIINDYRSLFLLSYQDSNLDKQNQKLLCYHYTIGQT